MPHRGHVQEALEQTGQAPEIARGIELVNQSVQNLSRTCPAPRSGHGPWVIAALCTGLAHMPAAWCLVPGPEDLAAQVGGCCTARHDAEAMAPGYPTG